MTRRDLSLTIFLLPILLLGPGASAHAADPAGRADHLAPGACLFLRLTAPVSTWTAQPGDPVHAVLTQNLLLDTRIILPMGTPVDGVVRERRKVGWGIRHETASLSLEFTHATTSGGTLLDFSSRVEEVENARETVRRGTIEGIRSTNTFQGTVNSRLIHLPTWNPYTDPVLAIYKLVFPIFPEPEIFYPAGTDLRVRTTSDLLLPLPESSAISPEPPLAPPGGPQLDSILSHLPARVTTGKNVDADLINVVFLGSEDLLTSAFHQAGWDTADPVSRRAVMHNLYALLNNDGYPRQPMSTFYLHGRPQDMSWQRSLNSYGRRDHLRVWRWTSSGSAAPAGGASALVPVSRALEAGPSPVWISSSTHDVGAVLSVKYRGFVHHIAPDLDEERSVVLRDLDFAGCVRSVTFVPRPGLASGIRNATGDSMHTDGRIAVIALQPCRPGQARLDRPERIAFRPGNHAFRFVRRQILTVRSDLWRANILYGAYEGTRWIVQGLRH